MKKSVESVICCLSMDYLLVFKAFGAKQ